MAEPIIWIIVIGYLLIGLFASGINEILNNGAGGFLIVILWPIVVAGLLLFTVMALPYILGAKLGELIETLMK